MMDMLAYCGIECAECPAYIGTQSGDTELLERTARRWSEGFGEAIDPEDILCDGCKSGGDRHAKFCSMCAVRACSNERGFETCARCDDYACEKLEFVFGLAPEARAKLEELRNA